MGAVYLAQQEPHRALKLLANFTAEYGATDAELLVVLGQAYLGNGDFDKGIATINKALDINPKVGDARANLALAKMAAGKLDEATGDLEVLVESDDGSQQLNTLLILSYQKLNQFDKALALVNASIEKYPDALVVSYY